MNLATIIMAAFGVLLTLLGIERSKGKKKNQTIERQKAEIAKEKVQVEVLKESTEVTREIAQAKEEILHDQKKEEIKIEKAENETDVINLANAIIANFNRVPDGGR